MTSGLWKSVTKANVMSLLAVRGGSNGIRNAAQSRLAKA
jgi:hypothetical protein